MLGVMALCHYIWLFYMQPRIALQRRNSAAAAERAFSPIPPASPAARRAFSICPCCSRSVRQGRAGLRAQAAESGGLPAVRVHSGTVLTFLDSPFRTLMVVCAVCFLQTFSALLLFSYTLVSDGRSPLL